MFSKSLSYKVFIILVTVFCSQYAVCQSDNKKEDALKKKIYYNAKLFETNIDSAYQQLPILLQEARKSSDYLAELKLLERKCRYFYGKNRIDSLIRSSEKLKSKAIAYDDPYSQAMGSIYLAEAYSINQFYDKALYQLDIAYTILEKDRSGEARIFYAKANVLSSFANVYTDKGEPKNAIKKLLKVINSYSELKDKDEIKRFQYINYSNIASLYLSNNIDSAYYYVNKSLMLNPKKSDDKIMMSNYYILGKIYKEQNRFDKAIDFFHKSIKISKKEGSENNLRESYKDLVDLFKKNKSKDSAVFYENELKQLEINILQSKYNSLQEVIVKDQNDNQNETFTKNIWFTITTGIILMVLIAFIYQYIKKRKEIALDDGYQGDSPEKNYKNLIRLLEKHDPAFMFSFEKTFPDFSEKLLKINPHLSKTEIEFCALIKLNLPTKEIAKLTFIESRTVQNKKYRIRKRLNIPQSVDIYNWFGSF